MEYLKSLGKRVVTIVVAWNVVVILLIGTIFLFGIVLAIFAAAAGGASTTAGYSTVYGTGTNQLLSIDIKGMIIGTDDSAGSLFSGLDSQTAGYTIKDKLYAAADDDMIRGVILEIDSPGGTIFGAHAIADGVKYYKEKTKRPVYAHISGMGASGAYWGAVAADKVFADYGSDIGSIGVILGPIQYYNTPLAEDGGILGGGIITQNGIESTTITAGKSKDIGNPFRKLTTEEVATLQKQVNNEYDVFVGYVSERRGIPDATIRGQIGAMSYDTKSAQELKLTDGTMSRQDAYDKLAEAAKIKDDYTIIREEPQLGFMGALLGAATGKKQPEAKQKNLCSLSRISLAYHGDVSSWCK